jgi:hypothetical protein
LSLVVVVKVEEMMTLAEAGVIGAKMVLVAEVISAEVDGVKEEGEDVIDVKKTSRYNLTRESRPIFVKLKLLAMNISMELHRC